MASVKTEQQTVDVTIENNKAIIQDVEQNKQPPHSKPSQHVVLKYYRRAIPCTIEPCLQPCICKCCPDNSCREQNECCLYSLPWTISIFAIYFVAVAIYELTLVAGTQDAITQDLLLVSGIIPVAVFGLPALAGILFLVGWCLYASGIAECCNAIWDMCCKPIFGCIGNCFGWIFDHCFCPCCGCIWDYCLEPVCKVIGKCCEFLYECCCVPIFTCIAAFFMQACNLCCCCCSCDCWGRVTLSLLSLMIAVVIWGIMGIHIVIAYLNPDIETAFIVFSVFDGIISFQGLWGSCRLVCLICS